VESQRKKKLDLSRKKTKTTMEEGMFKLKKTIGKLENERVE
jgi:hypothetical protein